MHVCNGATKVVSLIVGGKPTIEHDHEATWKVRIHARISWTLRINENNHV